MFDIDDKENEIRTEIRRYKGIFITGTDTSVGKTFITIGLLRALQKMGFNVCPMKPVETGCKILKGKLIPEDAFKLINAAGIIESLDLINPYRFKHPLAPAVAAELEEVAVVKKKIISAYKKLSRRYDLTIVEGAGGLMVPLYKKYLFIDLIKDLNLPLIIVARPGLGTINHTLLTIDAARNRGLSILGVIINYSMKVKKDISVKTNPEIIERLGGVPLLGTVPYAVKPACALSNIFSGIAAKIIN